MKSIMKKMSMILVGVLLISTFTACAKFDASAYVKAILDNSYYNDVTGILEQEVGTAEEAAAAYEQGIEAQMNAMLTGVSISDELYDEYKQFYKELYSSVKYTVGEATEVDDSTIEVVVSYEKMNVFVDAMAAYEVKVADLVSAWTAAALAGEEIPAEEAMNEELFVVLKECMVAELADATYEAPATLTIRLELVNNVWTPNQEDLMKLEYSLFDLEGIYEM